MPDRLRRLIGDRLGEGRSRRLLAAAGVAAAVAAVTGVIVGAGLPGSSKGASSPKTAGAATVQRRDLVSTDTESGTLGYANPQTVYNRLTGTVTWLPKIGAQIKPGGTLFRVDDAPVVLFDGTTPAYRTLAPGVTDGPDVGELNRNLVALGFDPSRQITLDNTWQDATTAAAERWQAALGESQTGTVTLGQAVFLPGPQVVTTVQTVLGSAGGSSSSGSGSSGSSGSSGTSAAYTTSGSSAEFVSLTTTKRAAPTGPTGPTGPSGPGSNSHSGGSQAQLKALTALLKAETAELRSKGSSSAGGGSPASSGTGARSSGGGSGGSGGGSGAGGGAVSTGGSSGGGGSGSASAASAGAQAVLQTTSTQEVVTVDLDATKQTEAVVGEPVTVQLPDGSTVNGKITAVSPVAQSSSSSSSSSGSGSSSSGSGSGSGSSSSSSSTPSATIPVTIALSGSSHVKGLDQAAVSVNFAQQKANNVLSVPVTALIATQGGGYALQEAARPHSLIPVTPGLFAAGYVQISGSGVYPGLEVTDSQG